MAAELRIATFIRERCSQLGFDRAALVRACRYKQFDHGLYLLDELCAGRFQRSRRLIERVSRALKVTEDTVGSVLDETRRQMQDEEFAVWSATFAPHAVLLTERSVPSPIFAAGLLGVR